MKLGATLSTSLHTAILAWALLSLSGPAPLVTMEESGVEVDFAPLSPDASSANGEKKADAEAKPVPVPTTRPQEKPEAKILGDAKDDGSKSRKGEVTDKPLDTEKTSAAPEAQKVVKAPKVEPEPVRPVAAERVAGPAAVPGESEHTPLLLRHLAGGGDPPAAANDGQQPLPVDPLGDALGCHRPDPEPQRFRLDLPNGHRTESG